MNDDKYIGLDVHQATISVAVLDSVGKVVMESMSNEPQRCSATPLGMDLAIQLSASADSLTYLRGSTRPADKPRLGVL